MPETKTLPETLDVRPRIVPPFDPDFRPMVLAYRNYEDAARSAGGSSAMPRTCVTISPMPS